MRPIEFSTKICINRPNFVWVEDAIQALFTLPTADLWAWLHHSYMTGRRRVSTDLSLQWVQAELQDCCGSYQQALMWQPAGKRSQLSQSAARQEAEIITNPQLDVNTRVRPTSVVKTQNSPQVCVCVTPLHSSTRSWPRKAEYWEDLCGEMLPWDRTSIWVLLWMHSYIKTGIS